MYSSFLECWDGDPDNRPSMNQIVARLKAIITKTNYLIDDNAQLSNERQYGLVSNSLHGELSQFTQKFDKMDTEETKHTTTTKDLSIIIDELVNFISKEIN